MVIPKQRRKDLEAATKLYLGGYSDDDFDVSEDFDEYGGFYHLSNEPFESFLEIVTLLPETKALSVLASGDQVFELILEGLNSIDTFDINRLTEYFALGFKKRAIECLSFEDYNKLFKYYKDFDTQTHYCQHLDLEKYVIENMDDEYKWFWKELFYNLKQHNFDASVFHFCIDGNIKTKNYAIPSSFMMNKKIYKELQKKLLKSEITFKQTSILDFKTNVKKKYDLIYLSNIMEHYYSWFDNGFRASDQAIEVLKSIYDNNLEINGEILQSEIIGSFLPILCKKHIFNSDELKFVSDKKKACVLKKKR